MTRAATKLEPCPFCGSEAKDYSHHSCDCCGKSYTGIVQCVNPKCGAEVSHFDTADEAIAAWNRRGHEVIISPIHPNRPARVVKMEVSRD